MFKVADRIKESSLTAGTGSVVLNGAINGFQTFLNGIGDGNSTFYAIENESQWEVGVGTYTASTNSLSRDVVYDSSNSGNKISLVRVSTVFCTYPAGQAIYENNEGKVSIGRETPSYQLDVLGSGRFDTIVFGDGTTQSSSPDSYLTALVASGVAISGWAKYYVDHQDHSASAVSGMVSTSYLPYSGAIKNTDMGNYGLTAISGNFSNVSINTQATTYSSPALNVNQTWNSSPTTFTAIKSNIIDTASSASSLLMDLQVGGTSLASINKSGFFYAQNINANASNWSYLNASATVDNFWNGAGVTIKRGSLSQGFAELIYYTGSTREWTIGTGAGSTNLFFAFGSPYIEVAKLLKSDTGYKGAFHLYNTSDNGNNYERGVIDWITTSNVLRIGTEAAGTGTVRNIALVGGKVGIGTTTPSYKLDVSSSEYFAAQFIGAGIYIQANSSDTNPVFWVSSNYGNTHCLYIAGNGRVGIGTTSPSSRLDISDTTGAGSGSLAASILNLAQTWSTTGTPTAIKLNVTEVQSNAASLLMDLQVGGVSKVKIQKNAATSFIDNSVGVSIKPLPSALTFAVEWISSIYPTLGSRIWSYRGGGSYICVDRANDTAENLNVSGNLQVGEFYNTVTERLYVNGTSRFAGTIEQRSGTTAQRFNLYGTYDSNGTNYRRLYLDSTTAGAFKIGVEGLGTGASGNTLELQTGGTTALTLGSDGWVTIPKYGATYPYFRIMANAGTAGFSVVTDASGNAGVTSHSNFSISANYGNFSVYAGYATRMLLSETIRFTADTGISIRNTANTSNAPVTASALSLVDTWNSNISVTGASGDGTTATLTFSAITTAIPVGSTIVVTSVNPSGYNGTFTVTASSTTSVSYLNATTGAYVSGGNIKQLFTALKVNVTDTSSDAGSLLADWQVGGLSKTKIKKDGTIVFRGAGIADATIGPSGSYGLTVYGADLTLQADYGFYLNGNPAISGYLSFSGWDVRLYRDAANTLALRNDLNAQNFRLYGTYTNASNYNRLALTSTTGGDYVLQPENAGTSANAGSLTINLSGNPTYKAQIEYNGGGMNFRLGAAPFVIQMFGDAFMPAGANTGSVGHEGYSRPWQYIYANRYSAGGQSLTGSQATSLFDATATWNTTGTPTAIKVRITDTTSNPNSRLLSLEQSTTNVVGDYYRFLVDKSGAFTSTGNALIGLGQGGGATVNVGNGFYIIGNGSGLSCHSSITTILASSKGIYLSADTNVWESHNGTATAATFRNYKTRSSDLANYERLTLSSAIYSSAVYNTILCESGGTGAANINLVLSPKGTGAILAQVPDGTATGGNARGQYAVDWSMVREAAGCVAAGNCSVIGGGQNNLANGSYDCVSGGQNNSASGGQSAIGGGYQNSVSGNRSVIAGGRLNNASGYISAICGGIFNAASGQYSFVGGGYQSTASGDHSAILGGSQGLANRKGMVAFGAGLFATQGDAQKVEFVLRIKTTDATATSLRLGDDTTRLTIPSGKVFAFVAKINGIKSDGSAVAFYTRKGCIKNVGGTTTLVGNIETIGTDIEDNDATNVAITADDTNDALQISVTGITGETWRWVAVVEGVEIGYGT